MPDKKMIDLCDRLRRETGSMFVIAVSPEEVGFSVDPRLAPRDFGETLEREIPSLVQAVTDQRMKGRANDRS